MDKTIYEMRLTQWTNIIQECNAGGMQKAIWCQQNGVDKKQSITGSAGPVLYF